MLGRLVKGEGVLGLSRAFQVAGANRVGATLWQVADEATREFMVRVYTRIVTRGMGYAEAVALTKREFMGDPRYAEPYYWSPFVLYGN